MRQIKMKIIKQTEVGNRPILRPGPELDALVKGEGNIDYICGNCGKVLYEKINKGQVTEIVVKCPVCGELNLS